MDYPADAAREANDTARGTDVPGYGRKATRRDWRNTSQPFCRVTSGLVSWRRAALGTLGTAVPVETGIPIKSQIDGKFCVRRIILV